jgi:hypothetical protein
MRNLVVVSFFCLFACGTSRPPEPPASPVAPPTPREPPGPSAPVVLVPPSADFDIVALVVDARRAYWAHRGEGGLVDVELEGGPLKTLLPGTEEAITSLSADEGFVYWTSGRHLGAEKSEIILGRINPRAGHYEGFVARIKKDGTGREELSSGRFEPSNVAVFGPNVYWVMVRPREETLVRLPPGTDAPFVVAHGTFAPGSLVVHGGHAYWIDPNAGPAVMRVSLGGGEPVKLAQGAANNPVHPVRLAADDEAVYWTDAGSSETGGAVVRVPVGAGDASLLAENLASPRGIAVEGGVVYWLEKGTGAQNFHDGTLRRVATRGGAPATLAKGLVAPDRIAVNPTRVVWTEVDGSVKVMGKEASPK